MSAMIEPDETYLSPNHYSTPVSGHTVIIHATRSGVSMNPTEYRGTINYMLTPGTVSSHWVVSRTGIRARVVPDTLMAWHAGVDNPYAWGIEVEQGVESDGFTEVQLAAVLSICKGYRDDFGVLPVHATGFGPHPAYGFIGHQETAQGRSYGKSDPGHLFPWDAFIASLQSITPTPLPAGIGAHYDDGSDEEIWVPRPGKNLDGVGMRLDDGQVTRIWPV